MVELKALVVNLLLITAALTLAAFAALPSWRSNPWWMLSGWALGPATGYIVHLMGAPLWLVLMATAVAAITAPATLAMTEGRNMFQIWDFLAEFADKMRGKSKGDDDKNGGA